MVDLTRGSGLNLSKTARAKRADKENKVSRYAHWQWVFDSFETNITLTLPKRNSTATNFVSQHFLEVNWVYF